MEHGASSGTLWSGVLEAMMTSTASFVVRLHCTLNANIKERCLWNVCVFFFHVRADMCHLVYLRM